MQGFSVQTTTSSAGEVRVGAPSDVEDVDQLIVRGERIIESEFYGSKRTGKAHDGVGHFLHLQPFLELAVSRYSKSLRRRTGMQVGLQWFLFQPSYFEFQLLSGVTALEHLVATFVKQRTSPRIVHPRRFRALYASVAEVLAAARQRIRGPKAAVVHEQLHRLANKFAMANEPSFREKLLAMLRFYGVPIAGLEKPIAAAIQARNVVVHTGVYRDPTEYRELYVHVVVIRELLKRIFLTLLGYAGQYHSMLNGPEWVEFPPPGPVTVDPP
jgi:hypothetical protein